MKDIEVGTCLVVVMAEAFEVNVLVAQAPWAWAVEDCLSTECFELTLNKMKKLEKFKFISLSTHLFQ